MSRNSPALVKALRVLARDIHCEDGVATAVIAEAAEVIDRGLFTDAEREAVAWCVENIPLTLGVDRAAVFRGLLERTAKKDTTPAPNATPSACTIPIADAPPPDPEQRNEWLKRPYWVDPPSGWRYGFPRLYDPAKDGDMTEWLVANGYPQHLADRNLPCTFTASTDPE